MDNENYFLDYDKETGHIKGFYLISIHGDNIPPYCLEITPEKHDFLMEFNGQYKINIETLLEELIPASEFPPSPKTEFEILKENQELMQKALDELILGGI